jgi:hypothetical protein
VSSGDVELSPFSQLSRYDLDPASSTTHYRLIKDDVSVVPSLMTVEVTTIPLATVVVI